MFNPDITLDQLNAMSKNTLVEHVGIKFIEKEADFLKASMPVDVRTHQPYGLLHGGASAVLAETLGSVASFCTIDSIQQYVFGLEINANHVRPVRSGHVYGTVTSLHVGRQTHIWHISIVNEEDKLVCVSRLTVIVKNKK
ncbi:hotdog fold thioesterase [Anaerolineales bacterium HSG6]|nr:hotdog fold thioesterase [Anaerolineales bacterium HSG6]MDM8532962.1 hotdog fold thioesterase [Anaerolineales bacterium HSG25]